MRNLFKRPIGQILLDGKFLSRRNLDQALDEQKNTHELLGQVLVRMGVLRPGDIGAPLLVQEHLNHIDDAVKIAAGERQLLGALLVKSGRITTGQLDLAIAEQKRSGEKLGEVLTRLGMLTERQLRALLDFQQYQATPSTSPLRLGELLVATGHISREQLDKALSKQAQTGKKLGEVLVSEGFVRPNQIKHGIRLQKMLVNSVLAAILSLSMSSVSSASSVALQWDPNTDSDLAGYKVYYAVDSASLASATPVDVHSQTTTTIDGLDPDKSYSFAVTAYNTAGQESGFSNVVAIPELSPPTVAITSPTDATSVSGTVSISVDATDNVGVTKVEFYINGVLTATETAGPYVYSWNTTGLAAGSYTLMTKAYDAAGNVSQSTKTVSVASDTTPPTVAVTSPANSAVVSGVISINANASDNVGVSMVEFYANGVLLYATNAAPYSFNWDTKLVTNGAYSLTARASDNSGNITNSTTVSVTVNNPVPDTTAPTLTAFSMPSTSTSLTVPVSSFTASDNVAATGYLITESSIAPSLSSSGWSSAAPTSFTFSGEGTKTAYAWTKDAAGNISASRSASVTITLPDLTAPTLTAFSMPSTSTTLTVPVSTFTASDNKAVTGYIITESSSAPSSSSSGWSSATPTSFTFSGEGTKTAYAWTKDAAGNVSSSKSASVTITLADTVAPTITFSAPTSTTITTSRLTVAASASDNVKVTKMELYLDGVLRLATTSSSFKTSLSVTKGTHSIVVKSYDAANNISSASKSVTRAS